jgi:CheY-like chemotaxis protein
MKKFHCILLVDDDFTSNFLSRMVIEGTQVADHIHTAQNGQEALQFVLEHCFNLQNTEKNDCPDLILLDINMPVMDGFGFLEEFSKLQRVRNRNISVVMLTSSANRKDMQRAEEYNVTGYLDKPLTEEKIKAVTTIE